MLESQSEDDFEQVFSYKANKKEKTELQEELTNWKATTTLDRSLLLGVLSKQQLKCVAQLDQTQHVSFQELADYTRVEVPEELDDIE